MLEQTHYYSIWKARAQLKETTLLSYQTYLDRFEHFLVDVHGVKTGEFDIDAFWVDEESGHRYAMDRGVIEEYVEWLEDEYGDHAPSLPPNCFRAVRSFFGVLKANGVIGVDPTVGVTPPAIYRSRKGVTLTHDELQSLLDAAFRKDPFARKYAAIVLILGGCGLRNRELRYLTANRIDFNRGLIIVDQGQKTAPGTVTMSSLVHNTLQHYLRSSSNPSWGHGGDDLVFPHESGRMFRAAELIDIIKALAKDAGIKKHVTPHALRRTLATEMYRTGVDPEIIRRAMRHKRLETTTGHYVNPDTEEDRQALQAFSMAGVLSRLATQYLLYS